MCANRRIIRLKFVLMADAILIAVLLWTAIASGLFYAFTDRCSAVVLPLELVSGLSESDFVSTLDANDCHIEEKRELLREPCRLTMYRCRSYPFHGKKYAVELQFLCGRLMSVAIQNDDDGEIGVGALDETKIKRRHIGDRIRYYDAEMAKEVDRFLLDRL